MTDQEKKDLAQSYQTMMDLAAWKHFDKNTLGAIERRAINDLITPDVAGDLADLRGQIKAIRKVRSDLSYILEGLK